MFTRSNASASPSRNHSDVFFKPNVQAKLAVGKPGDRYEVEADRTADKVVSGLSEKKPEPFFPAKTVAPTNAVQTSVAPQTEKETEAPEIQEKPLVETITPVQASLLEEPQPETVQKKDEEDTIQQQVEQEPLQASLLEEPQTAPLQKKEEEETIQQQAEVEQEPLQTSLLEEPKAATETPLQASIETTAPAFAPKPVMQLTQEQNTAKEEQTEDEEIQEKEEEAPEKELQMALAEEDSSAEESVQLQVAPTPVMEQFQDFTEPVQKSAESASSEEKTDDVQAVQTSEGSQSSDISSRLNASKGGGSAMDTSTQSEMGQSFGADFSDVRIHTDDNAVQMNRDLGAQAFASGNNIYFNEGKYNPQSNSGKHLLAHELTHTVQQGASPKADTVQTAPDKKKATTIGKPVAPLDITHRFELNDEWAKHLDAQYAAGERKLQVDVKIGDRYAGMIEVAKKNGTKSGETAKYGLIRGNKNRFLDINGWEFLDPLRNNGLFPILVLNDFAEDGTITGFLSLRSGETPMLANVNEFLKGFNTMLDKMRFLGLEPLKVVDGLENKFEAGRLIYQITALKTVIDGYLEAGGGLGITGDKFTFNANAKVSVPGIAEGELMIARGEDGTLSGSIDISADIANVNAQLHAEYIDGVVTIQGTGRINSEKFSGEITLLVTDAARSKQMMHAALGIESMDEAKEEAPGTPVAKTKDNQVLAGWGEITANITPWLAGTAKVGIDAEGHVTIVGEITVPNEVELMEQRGKKVDIFKFEIRAGYGIPLVGQVFLFASIGMFVNAGFGPLVLKNVGFTGTYSTDPDVLQNFSVTGTLGINAFAILGLEAEAGVGLTLLGHDIKAGVNVTAAAGLRAYAEATPTLEYKEERAPEGGKTGETHLKGHFEAAAQLFLQLSGALFYELDSPWWSPAPDGREEYPLGEVQYPIGDSMGIGADMDWLVGSSDIPEIKFSPVEFDADKFTSDIMADPPPRKMGNAKAEPPGEWEDGNKTGDQSDKPEMKDGNGLPENSKKKEDLKKLPDEQKYMRALDEMSKFEKANPKATISVVKARAQKVKSKYDLDQINVTDNDETAEIYVKHKDQNNKQHILEVPLMSEAERAKLLFAAMEDLKKRSETAADPKAGTIEEAKAKDLLSAWQKAHPVVEEAHVTDGKETWDYLIDIGDKTQTLKGKLKKLEKPAEENGANPDAQSLFGLSVPVAAEGGHTLKIEGDYGNISINVYSKPKSLNELINDKRVEINENKSLDPDFEAKWKALNELDEQKKVLGTRIGAYKRAVDNAYEAGAKKADIPDAYQLVRTTLSAIATNLQITGIDPKKWDLPPTKVLNSTANGMAKRVIAQPLTSTPGNTQGGAADADPVGWDTIDVALRRDGSWVRAHLLNHKLHGPGNQTWNLFPGTRKMNLDDMERQVESDAKTRIAAREVLFYNVVLTYGNKGTYSFIPTEVFMEYGAYNVAEEKKGQVYQSLTFKQDPPSGAATPVNNLNLSSAKNLDLIAQENGMTDMHGFFVNIAKGRKGGAYKNNTESIKARMLNLEYYVSGSAILNRHIANLKLLLEDQKITV